MVDKNLGKEPRADVRAVEDETTPLLGKVLNAAADTTVAVVNGVNGVPRLAPGSNATLMQGLADEDKPFPVGQVLILCFASLVEPISYFAIFPIVADMLVKVGDLDVKDISMWSGLIEALFSMVQMSVMLPYGKLSDRIGRKPVLVWSLFGIAGCSAMFGLAQNLWQMILLRAVTGFFAGSAVTVRAMLSEVSSKKTQARAFSWFMFSKNLGIFIGPLIGGTLADPVKNIPLFHDSTFFKQFPFALSMFVAGAVCTCAALLNLFLVKETLKTKILKTDQGEVEAPMTTGELMRSPGVRTVLYLYGHVGGLALMYTAVCPVFDYTPVNLGGLGFTPPQISMFVALAGASQAFWMLGPFPPLQNRFGTGPVFRACTLAWPWFMALSVVLNELRRHGADNVFWVVMPVTTVLGSGVAMAFACVQLCLNDVAPSSNTLGTLNAIALTINSGIRAVAPILGTALYEFGVKSGFADGHLIWVILTSIAVLLAIGVRFLPPNAEGLPDRKKPSETEPEE